MLFGYIHLPMVAPLGAFSTVRGKKVTRNNGLESRFGGYTAHHLSQCSQELARHPCIGSKSAFAAATGRVERR
jgi:hypothetical protein